ncbi:hypothetical protein HAX54_000169 [Datura stramonium]|uniref:Uncharacterized protein n=1 Tax=Datura stramonium TaxID=4076 RepID=A0ABS8T1L4_DATST|nr:hypothetical protein [Datura stramonium]
MTSQPDMGDSSLRGRLAALNLTYQKGLQAVVSLFNRINKAFSGTGAGFLMLPYSLWWILFSLVPFVSVVASILNLMGDPKVFTLFLVLDLIVMIGGYLIHCVVLFYVVYWYRDMPFQLIGANTKFMIEVIPMITVAALHHLLAANYAYIALLISLGCTGYFYTFAHFLHVAYDIGAIDVSLGLVMQVLGYMLIKVELLFRGLALSFCLGFSFYRYMTYCSPEIPAHHKKESELLPC